MLFVLFCFVFCFVLFSVVRAVVVVAKQGALDLVDYLLSLDRTYPAANPELRDNGFADDDVEVNG